jgi:CDGSH-type Zn-finger protein
MPDTPAPKKGPIIQDTPPGTYWWCACGRSQTQPFCDGSHKGTGIAPRKVDIPQEQTVAWCTCKQSKNPPFCDGSHRNL